MARGEIKDFFVALAVGVLASLIGHAIQHFSGGIRWLPNGPMSFAFWQSAYWFSRYPLWKSR